MTDERRFSPDELARVLQRAVELSAREVPRLGAGGSAATGDGVSLTQLSAAAVEAGIPAEHLRQAVAELDSVHAGRASRLYGSPTQIIEERHIPRVVAAEEFDAFLDDVRAEFGMLGVHTLTQRSVHWSSVPPGTPIASERRLTVTLRTAADHSVLRVEEDLSPDVGAAFGLGGVIAIPGGILSAILLATTVPPLVVVAPALPVGAWLFARRVLRRTYHTRRGALGNFATRLAHRLRSALP